MHQRTPPDRTLLVKVPQEFAIGMKIGEGARPDERGIGGFEAINFAQAQAEHHPLLRSGRGNPPPQVAGG